MATITNPGVPVPLSNGLTYYVKPFTLGGMDKLTAWGREAYEDSTINLLLGVGFDHFRDAAGVAQLLHVVTGESLDDINNLGVEDTLALWAKWTVSQHEDSPPSAKKKGKAAPKVSPSTQPQS